MSLTLPRSGITVGRQHDDSRRAHPLHLPGLHLFEDDGLRGAIGVDMTDAMLGVANENKPKVAAPLCYDVVELRKGYLEQIPVESKRLDLITSTPMRSEPGLPAPV